MMESHTNPDRKFYSVQLHERRANTTRHYCTEGFKGWGRPLLDILDVSGDSLFDSCTETPKSPPHSVIMTQILRRIFGLLIDDSKIPYLCNT